MIQIQLFRSPGSKKYRLERVLKLRGNIYSLLSLFFPLRLRSCSLLHSWEVLSPFVKPAADPLSVAWLMLPPDTRQLGVCS